jgi:hypothetical protein
MADLNPIELQKALKGADYPASRDDLVQRLANAGTSRFDGPDDVQKALFGE